jgi:hypothetical protein
MALTERPEEGFFQRLIGDGRPLLLITAGSLAFSGGFAIFLSAAKQFLPQDVSFLGLTADQLCRFARCRPVLFMIHDRVAFGGALIAIAALYTWLTLFPLRAGAPWAWWALVVTGAIGFGSFLGYLGYGYLDSWHGIGTLLLLPVFVGGLVATRPSRRWSESVRALIRLPTKWPRIGYAATGRTIMGIAAASMAIGGLVVLWVGVTDVFVPQDLTFMHTTESALDSVTPRLVPLMAHDRAGFGGAVTTTAVAALFCVWYAAPSRALWQALALAWFVNSGCAIGIHLIVGYRDLIHLAPAVLGAGLFGIGLILSRPVMYQRHSEPD